METPLYDPQPITNSFCVRSADKSLLIDPLKIREARVPSGLSWHLCSHGFGYSNNTGTHLNERHRLNLTKMRDSRQLYDFSTVGSVDLGCMHWSTTVGSLIPLRWEIYPVMFNARGLGWRKRGKQERELESLPLSCYCTTHNRDNGLFPFPRALETRGRAGYPTSWRISDISGVLTGAAGRKKSPRIRKVSRSSWQTSSSAPARKPVPPVLASRFLDVCRPNSG